LRNRAKRLGGRGVRSVGFRIAPLASIEPLKGCLHWLQPLVVVALGR
jgi:hypothetical protein